MHVNRIWNCSNTIQPSLVQSPNGTLDTQTDEQNTLCIQFYCEQDGIWSVTQWNTNTTVDNACYDRTVPGKLMYIRYQFILYH